VSFVRVCEDRGTVGGADAFLTVVRVAVLNALRAEVHDQKIAINRTAASEKRVQDNRAGCIGSVGKCWFLMEGWTFSIRNWDAKREEVDPCID
jgi:hypothetical protein